MADFISGGIARDGMVLDSGSLCVSNGGEAADAPAAGEQLGASGLTVTNANGDVLLANPLPQAEYMYVCAPTSEAMLLGYYDLYGYRGDDYSALIDGDVELESRGTDGNKFNMNAFDTALGLATASRDYVYRFFSRTDLDVVIAGFTGTPESKPHDAVPTTPEEELEYSFVNGGEGPEIRTDVWNCIADYLGTGQFWRGNDNYDTHSHEIMLERLLNLDRKEPVAAGEIQREVDFRYMTIVYGLNLYVQSRGYTMDMKVTAVHWADVYTGSFTFEHYMREIDAGRPALVLIEGHIMTGCGYNAETREIIFDDCYTAGQRMAWDGTYYYAKADRPLRGILTVGLMGSEDIDLAVAPPEGAEEKLVIATTENQIVSSDCCFNGEPLYLSFGAVNLGTSPSGPFDAWGLIDGERKFKFPDLSLADGTVLSEKNILVEGLGVGLHRIRIELDPDNTIRESAALNNAEEAALMVLAEGTNVVQGTRQVASGEISRDDYVMNGAELHVLEGGTAERTLIQGKVIGYDANGEALSTPGTVSTAHGGLLREAAVYEYGHLEVSGMAEDLSLLPEGNVTVFDGGTISGISVAPDGILTVESGGLLTGKIQLGENADIVFKEGAVLNFDLTQMTAGGEALVSGLSFIRGTPTYRLAVADSQKGGTYVLADGAAGFDGTISLVDPHGAELGTFSVGDTLSAGEADFTLLLAEDRLSVRVAFAPANPVGSADGVSWDATGAEQYIVEYSADDFENAIRAAAAAPAVDLLELPAGTYQWRVRSEGNERWTQGENIVSGNTGAVPKVVGSAADGSGDIFFAAANGTWTGGYAARHVGSVGDWSGTQELVFPAGKNRIRNLFFGSTDPNILLLTDDANGDALFVDDIYTELPGTVPQQQSRIARIREIRAGAGDDIVDMTSSRFEYVGGGAILRGGSGDDTLWANKGENMLFGDAGNDRLVGASGNDVLTGGSGSDSMHGGGGSDIFVFCGGWGADTVEQLADGDVTLWFDTGSSENWDASTLTYTDGNNSVEVSGVTADKVSLKFGDDGSELYAKLTQQGAFAEFSSEKIFEKRSVGVLASV